MAAIKYAVQPASSGPQQGRFYPVMRAKNNSWRRMSGAEKDGHETVHDANVELIKLMRKVRAELRGGA